MARRASGWTLVRALTPFGWGLLAVGSGSVVVGVTMNWQEFSQLGVLALVLVGLALVWVLAPGAPSVELALAPRRITEGRRATAVVRVRAGARPVLSPLIAVPVSGSVALVRMPTLLSGRVHEETVVLPDKPRGIWTVGPVTVEKSDVLGLSRRSIERSGAVELWVRPRVVRLDLLTSGATTDLEGATSEQLTMSDLAFHALREYRPGDDLRHVHWRSSAKADQLLVRQYHETRRGHVTVLLDHEPRSYPRPSDFELAVSVAASVALRAVSDGLESYVRCGSDVVTASGAEDVLDGACRFRRHTGDYVASAMAAASAAPGTGLVVQVTGAARGAVEMRAAGSRFGPEAQQLVVRADPDGEPRVSGLRESREVRLATLEQLPGLLVGSLR